MKTQNYTASNLDGFIADERHSLDWLFQFGEEPDATYQKFLSEVGAIAMGSSTYEWILRNHISDDAPRPQPWMYRQPTWVFSSRRFQAVENADIYRKKLRSRWQLCQRDRSGKIRASGRGTALVTI